MSQIKDKLDKPINKGDTVATMAWGWTGHLLVGKVIGYTDSGNVRVRVSTPYNRESNTWAYPHNCVVVTKE